MHVRTLTRRWPVLIGPVLALILVIVSLTRAQAIADWLQLRNYQPPAAISQLAIDTTMTDKARHVFYLNHPAVESKTTFAKHCPSNGEKTIVLGCYSSGERGIYVLAVTDIRLQGVEQVTAAHEMLHASYERLSAKDKTYVDGLLEDYLQHGLTDQRIKDTLASYKTSEPGQELNEMHSIFGTEISKLPAPLETYYQRYFTDRAKIAVYAAQYQAAFTNRQATIKQDDAQLAAWKTQIADDEQALQTQQAALEAQQKQLTTYRTANNVTAYNALVPSYNASVDAYNTLVAETKSLIVQYNQLVNTRNALAVEETQLQQALDGSLSPIAQ